MPTLSPRTRRAARVLLLGAAVAGLVWLSRTAALLQPLELAAQDALVAGHAGQQQSDRISLVLASEEDIARFGWPLSDQLLADAIIGIAALGAGAIGIDIYRERPVGFGEEALARAQDAFANLYWVYRLEDVGHRGVPPPPRLAGTGRAVLADMVMDANGIVRRGLLLAEDPSHGGNVRTLGAAIAEHMLGQRFRPAGEDTLALGQGRIALLAAGSGAYARVDAAGYQMLLDFKGGADAFATTSLGALLDGTVNPALLAGRAVLLGTGTISVRDRFPTPVSDAAHEFSLMPGIAVHAHLADQLLRLAAGQSVSLAPSAPTLDALLLLAAGLLGAAIALALPAAGALLALALLLACVAVAASAAFTQGLLLPAVPVALAMTLAAAASIWLLHGLGAGERRRLHATFAHYLDDRVIRDMAQSDRPSFRGEQRQITALFTDLEDFSGLARTMDPAALAELMNRYFEGIARAITDAGGLLAEFTGDGVLALFGAPQPQADHAARAVAAALAIDRFTEGFRREAGTAMGGTRIGIASGAALVGHLGTSSRLRYGALGEVLTLAARLEQLNRTLGTRIALAAETAHAAGIDRFRSLGRHAVRGRADPVEVFSVHQAAGSPVRPALRAAAVLVLALLSTPAAASPGRDRALALEWLGRGTASFQAGDLEAAARAWGEAIRLCRTAGDPALEAEALARRGEVLRLEGKYRAAAEDLSAALALVEASGDARLVAASAGALGNLAFLARRTAEAEPLLLRARDTAARARAPEIEAAVANDLGNLYALTDRGAEAERQYAEATRLALAAGDPALAATAEVNAARLARDAGNPREAAPMLARGVDRLAALPRSPSVGFALVNAGHIAFLPDASAAAPLLPPARKAFAEAARIAASLNHGPLAAEALAGEARLAEQSGALDRAARLTGEARQKAALAGSNELRFRLDWQAGRIDRAARRDQAALAHYRRAILGLDTFRADIPVAFRDGSSSFSATFGPLYQQAADLLLRRATAEPAQAEALIGEARAALERLRATELQDYFRDPCVTALQARARPVEQVAADTAVLYPVVLPDRVELLLSVGGRTERATIPLPEPRLRAETEALRLALERRGTFEFLEPAGRLHAMLIAPIEPVLRRAGTRTLVVVPNGPLRLIPFAALHDGRSFLVERFAIATVPGMTLFDPRPLAATRPQTLAAGMAQAGPGYAALPAVQDEIAAIREARRATVLLDASFTRARFVSTLRGSQFTVVHVASHGEVGADPSKSFVRAHDGPISMDALEQALADTRFREDGIELLVLSACQTASGDDRAALGLAGLAVKAGARSAVASLWFVSDRASAALVAEFYQALGRGVSKAAALASAQRALIADPLLSHPAYWAPFLLIGNWL